MKKFLVIILSFVLSLSCNKEPKEIGGFTNGSMSLTSQKDVDDFVKLKRIGIKGNLQINSKDITDISGLSSLTTVYGNIEIKNTSLKTLDGLQNISSVNTNGAEFGVWVENNTLLESIEFSSLNSFKS